MKKVIKSIAFIGSMVLMLVAYGNSTKNQQGEYKNIIQPEITKEGILQNSDLVEGKKKYTQYCLACHQKDGMGASGMYPPLSKTEWVLGKKDRLIGVVLKGLSGEIEIDGDVYDNTMGSFAMLSNKDIAQILSYVRQSFGNKAEKITEAEVAKVRKTVKK